MNYDWLVPTRKCTFLAPLSPFHRSFLQPTSTTWIFFDKPTLDDSESLNTCRRIYPPQRNDHPATTGHSTARCKLPPFHPIGGRFGRDCASLNFTRVFLAILRAYCPPHGFVYSSMRVAMLLTTGLCSCRNRYSHLLKWTVKAAVNRCLVLFFPFFKVIQDNYSTRGRIPESCYSQSLRCIFLMSQFFRPITINSSRNLEQGEGMEGTVGS